jgi:DNA-binding response OmpR family regulator
MLTASGSVADRVEGLQLGADDYLPKPFAFDELVARVRALGRRATPAAPPVLVMADVVLDQTQRTVTRAGEPVDLTRKEFGILEELLKARAAWSQRGAAGRVWDANTDPFTTTGTGDDDDPAQKLGDPPLIETVVGVGYRVPVPGPGLSR